MASRLVGLLAACAQVAVIHFADQAPPPKAEPLLGTGTASISGRVIDDRGAPVARALVTLSSVSGRGAATVETGADGVYRFDRIPDGQYAIQTLRTGYVVGLLRPGDTSPPLNVAMTSVVPDQHRDDVHLVLVREGRIRGRITDAAGRPLEGVSVGAGSMFNGRFVRSAMMFRVAPGSARATEDGVSGPDGVYQIPGLPAGEMIVEANPGMLSRRAGATVDYHSTFYPDTPSAELASPVTVEAGRVTDGIDFRLHGNALGTLSLRITPHPQTLTDLQCNVVAFPGKQIRSVKIDNDGVAHVQSLKEGRYAVWSRARTGQDAVAAFRMMDFRADSPEVALPLEATGRITGRVAAARGGLPPVDGLKVDSALTHGGELVDHLAVDLAEVMPDGRFELEGQFGVRRVSLRGLPSGWAVRELLIGRQARTQADLEVPPGATLDIVFVVERR